MPISDALRQEAERGWARSAKKVEKKKRSQQRKGEKARERTAVMAQLRRRLERAEQKLLGKTSSSMRRDPSTRAEHK